ncbi:hypothetical protein [Agrobacterium sp. LMR679]|uniref:hypothetical protein n=1 Tax=Agrobacterium sp. LMR679 TaxID=3014335 RepID=UPI0022AF6D42|nr:hypothetical protein [Agrobacterium sp. LMR679]MCZ4072710.1 hypothetical protein [Agrobacterium sp. LMR679]
MKFFGILAIVVAGIWGSAATAQELETNATGKFLCGGAHPRCSVMDQSTYGYHQFGGRPVGQYAGVSHLLEDGPPLEHYQTFIGEVISKRPNTNAVGIWGDASAVVNNARVWGGFFSARSGGQSQDSQLIGLEVDVLNAGLDGVYPNHSKVGIQVVGFGGRNTNALEVLTEGNGKGRWQNGLTISPESISADGTVIGVGHQQAAFGIDFRGSSFSDSAMIVSPQNRITFRQNGKHDAAIYRDQYFDGHLVVQAGPSGIRVTNAQNTENLVIITPDGDVISKYGSMKNLAERIAALEAGN